MISKPKPGFLLNPLDPINEGLVAWWPFNEGGGPVIRPVPDNLFNERLDLYGNIVSPQWSGSPLGGSLLLNGSTSRIIVDELQTTGTNYNNGRVHSVAFWVRLTQVGNIMSLFGTVNTDNTGRVEYNVNEGPFGVLNNGSMSCLIQFQDLTHELEAYTGDVGISDGRWHHLIFIHNYQAQTVQFWVDGVQVPTIYQKQEGQGNDTTFTHLPNFGARSTSGGPQQFLNGAIADIRMYNRDGLPLSPNEIKRLYSNPYAGIITPASSFNKSLIGASISNGSGGSTSISILRRRRR